MALWLRLEGGGKKNGFCSATNVFGSQPVKRKREFERLSMRDWTSQLRQVRRGILEGDIPIESFRVLPR